MNPIIITKFGHDYIMDYFIVSQFADGKAAHDYSVLWNNVDLGGGKWSQTEWAEDWKKILPKKHVSLAFDKIIVSIDDRSIQKILREIDTTELCHALKGLDPKDAVCVKIYNNMSKRAVAMLKEDMEFMGPIRSTDQVTARDHIVKIYEHLLERDEVLDVTDENSTIIE